MKNDPTKSNNGRFGVLSDQPGNQPNWLGQDALTSNPEEKKLIFSVKSNDKCPPGMKEIKILGELCIGISKSISVDFKLIPFPVLTNPNKCFIGYHKTRFRNDQLPRNKDWFFPRMSSTPYGDFARVGGSPAKRLSDGSVKRMSSLTEFKNEWVENLDLYVDCKKSVLSMSSARLFNITYDQQDFENLKSIPNQVIYTRKMMINNSTLPTESEIKFQIETFDNVSMKLSQSHSTYFHTDEQTYKMWSGGAKVKFLKFLGFEAEASTKNEKWTNTSVGRKSNDGYSCMNIHMNIH